MTKWVILAVGLFLLTSPGSASVLGEFFESAGNLISNILTVPAGLVNFVLQDFNFYQQEVPDFDAPEGFEIDFIIVGAGSAGSVLASRLSEANATVLLIEAGGPESKFYGIPAFLSYLPLVKDIIWDLRTEPSDRYCLGMEGNSCTWPQGKVLGGTSTINAMLATRGNQADFDEWERMGNPGWSYDDVLEYFIKLENNTASSYENYDPSYRGTEGPVPINFVNRNSKMVDAFLQIGKELGFPLLDYNGKSQIGFSPMQTNTKNGERYSANRAYLHPARNRGNLMVSRHSQVTKIDIDPETKRAVGVTFEKDGKAVRVRARKEVILSAGALHTPQLLMLSGIGPADHLAQMNVKVLRDAPGVGKNLMDHVTFLGGSYLIEEGNNAMTIDMVTPWNTYISDYLTERKGILSAPAGIEAIAYLNIDDLGATDGPSNVELLYGEANVMTGDRAYHWIVGMKPDVYGKTYGKFIDHRGFQIFPVLTKPKSRGEVLLKSSNIKDNPRLIPNYYEHPDDMEQMMKAVRLMNLMTQSDVMKKFGAKIVPEPIHGCEKLVGDEAAYWECALRTLTYTFWHFSGTAKMGPSTDPMAVVDNELKVYGIEGLRVVDASIMPEVPSAHTNLPTMMVAEKASDMIKRDWGFLNS